MIHSLIQWTAGHALFLLITAVSTAVLFIVTLAALPVFFVLIPPDFFVHREKRFPALEKTHPAARIMLLIVKNIFGTIFTVIGILMLFLPGQGILTMLLGLTLIDFPKKRKIVRKILRNRNVSHSINALREKFGREPLLPG